MDLIDLMSTGAGQDAAALDRLRGIVALYDSEHTEVQDEALARAISFCGRQWGSYKAGLEALATRVENDGGDLIAVAMEALRLREEAEDPGGLIRAARERREEAERIGGTMAALIARYGSAEAAATPAGEECQYIAATQHLADEDTADDPWGPLAGWSLPWHPLPESLATVVAGVRPLPTDICGARSEALRWNERKREYSELAGGRGDGALPTACAARYRLVEAMWRRDLPARSLEDLEARLDYWTALGGEDGTGYAVVLDDVRRLPKTVIPPVADLGETTSDRARRLKGEHPDWSLAQIGKALGISRQAVHKHLRRHLSD